MSEPCFEIGGDYFDLIPADRDKCLLVIADVAGKEHAALLDTLKKKQKHLNELVELDYDEVIKIKTAMLNVLYEARKHELAHDAAYNKFFETNKHWLVPYAAFC